jgi:hypothetical protein
MTLESFDYQAVSKALSVAFIPQPLLPGKPFLINEKDHISSILQFHSTIIFLGFLDSNGSSRRSTLVEDLVEIYE